MPEEENVNQLGTTVQAQAHEPANQKKSAKRTAARKAAKPGASLSVTEIQALMAAFVDTDDTENVPAAVQRRLDAGGVAYLAAGSEIYGVVLAPADYDTLVAKRPK